MARPFSYPEVAKLEVGEGHTVPAAPDDNVKRKVAEVGRKVRDYGKRCNPPKTFAVEVALYGVRVTRLPDPVADLPGVA